LNSATNFPKIAQICAQRFSMASTANSLEIKASGVYEEVNKQKTEQTK